MTNEITWKSEISIDLAARIIGSPELVSKLSRVECESRAHGAWVANERESHAAWKAIAKSK